MYVPPHFSVTDKEVLHKLIHEHPLGVLVTHGAQGLDANHVPFELNPNEGEHGVLRAHVARANPVWNDVSNGADVIAVFRADEAYVSPTWYPSKHEFHKQVPSWNYRVAHVHGKITIHDDEKYVRGVVARLTRTHEASQPAPWKMTDSPKDFIDMMLKAIVGIEIEITSIVGKFKLSQNREVRDRQGLAKALIAQGDTDLAQATLDTITSSN